MRLCSTAGCTSQVVSGNRCRECAREANRRYTSQNKRYYGRAKWRHTRRKQLHEQPLCEQCGALAEDVHHRVDIQDGGEVWAMDNLMSMCHACHSKITRAEQLNRAGL
ncbi:MAG: HNH endonuclease signature motif containing protein [Actinomycetota bacterium]